MAEQEITDAEIAQRAAEARKAISDSEIAQKAKEARQDLNDPDGFVGTAKDIGQGIASGAQRGLDATLNLAGDAAESFINSDMARSGPGGSALEGEEKEFELGTAENLGDIPDAETTAGQLASGLSQFAVGMVGGGKVLKAAQWAKSARPIVRSMAQGAIADFAAFEEHEKRLSNLVEETAPALSSPVTRFLAADEDDAWWEGRLKNTVEGAGLGATGDLLFRSAKFIKNGKRAAKADPQKAVDDVQQGAKELDETRERAAAQFDGSEPRTDLKEQGSLGVDQERSLTGAQKFQVEEGMNAVSRGQPEARSVVMNDPADVEATRKMFQMAQEGKITFDEASKNIPINNAGKFVNLEEDAKVAMDRIGRVLQETNPDLINDSQSWGAARNIADHFQSSPEEVLKRVRDLSGQSEDIQATVLAANSMAESVLNGLPKMARKVEAGEASQEEFDALLDYAFQLEEGLKGTSKTMGRGLNIHKAQTKEGEEAINFKNLRELVRNPEFAGDKKDFMRKLQTLEDHPNGVARAMRGAFSRKAWDLHNEVWLNALLSGPKTHVINQTSNAIQAVLHPAENLVGGAIRRDPRSMRHALNQYAGMVQYAGDAMRYAGRAMKQEDPILDPFHVPTEQLGRNKQTSEALGAVGKFVGGETGEKIGRGTGAVLRTPTRLLAVGDEFWKQLQYRSKLYAMATDEAARRNLSTEKTVDLGGGKKASEFDQYVADYFEAGFDDAGRAANPRALEAAQEQTFTQPLREGTVGKRVQQITNENPATKLLMPFVRTPTNLFRQAWQRTPGINLLQAEYREALKSADPVKRSQALGKMASGSAFWSTALGLGANGQITGGGPSDPEIRSKIRENGWKPYAVKIGDKYHQFNRLDPVGMIFGIAGDVAEAGADLADKQVDELSIGMTIAAAEDIFSGADSVGPEKAAQFAQDAALAVPKNLASKTYMKALTDTLTAVMEGQESRAATLIESRAGSYVPNFLRQSRKAMDPTIREVRGVVDSMKAGIPGFADDLEAQRNVFGEKVMRKGSPIQRLLSPVSVSKEEEDPVVTEMVDLGKSFPGVPEEKGNLKLTAFTDSNGNTAWSRWNDLVKNSGMKDRMREMIQSDQYQRMSEGARDIDISYPGTKSHVLGRILNEHQRKTFAELVKKHGDEFTSESGMSLFQAFENEKRNEASVKQGSATADELFPVQ